MSISQPCWEQSLQSGEPINGSAVASVQVWMLLEYREPWERDIADCTLPAKVRELLDGLSSKYPEMRMQFIRGDKDGGPLSFYVATTGILRGVHRFLLSSYDELLHLDLEAMITGDVTSPANSKELYLVCTHGKRDRCCARRGVAYYRMLLARKPDAEVWQSSHQGGHRFAATCLYLPFGVHYGRLEAAEAEPMVDAHERKEILKLDRYRGMTHLSSAAQTAEAWLRKQEMIMSIDGVRDMGEESLGDTRCAARFRTSDGTLHRITVEQRTGDKTRKKSCAAQQAELPSWFEVVRHEAQTPPPSRSTTPRKD